MEKRLMTREEWNRVVALKPFIHYTKEEATFITDLTREFVNPKVENCQVCPGSATNAKQQLYGWFNDQKDIIDAKLKEMEQAKQQVQEYVEEPQEKIEEVKPKKKKTNGKEN